MKTAEEILQSYWEKIIDGELYISKVNALKAMEKYAEQQVKNLNIPVVMAELTCDNCGYHPNVLYTTSKGRFCERCKPAF